MSQEGSSDVHDQQATVVCSGPGCPAAALQPGFRLRFYATGDGHPSAWQLGWCKEASAAPYSVTGRLRATNTQQIRQPENDAHTRPPWLPDPFKDKALRVQASRLRGLHVGILLSRQNSDKGPTLGILDFQCATKVLYGV